MKLDYDSPEAREEFLDWYHLGEHKGLTGEDIEPEGHPDIHAIVDYFNNEVAFGHAVEVIDDEA